MEQRQLTELGVLGFLNEREASLGTIQDRFNHNFGRHQFAGHGVLEPALARLREQGHVRGSPTYRITESGRDRLRELLREPVSDVADPTQRPHLLVKLGFLHHLPPSEQDDEVARLEDQFHRARAEWIDVANAHGADEAAHSGYRLELIELTIQLLDAQLEWIGELRCSIE